MEIFKKTIVRDILTNIIYLILIVIYFVYLNIQGSIFEATILTKYINISSLIFLGIAIVMLEIGFRKNEKKFLINGIETLILATSILLIKHLPKTLGYSLKTYTDTITCAFIAYYISKSAIMFTKERYDYLKNLSDIKQIVKEEPTKKTTKRKNIKIEEGK